MKTFDRKSNYTTHCNRINKCLKITSDTNTEDTFQYSENTKMYLKEYKCKFCNKNLSNNSNYHKHLRICKHKITKEKDDQLKEELLTLLVDIKQENKKQQEKYENKINELQKEIKKQTEKISKLENAKSSKIITKNSNNKTINNNINLLTYSKTDTTHLTDKDYLNCIKHSNMMIPHLIDKIHFDEDKPENRNIYISNMRNNYILVYEEGKWKMKNRDETINHLIDDKEIIIKEKLEDCK